MSLGRSQSMVLYLSLSLSLSLPRTLYVSYSPLPSFSIFLFLCLSLCPPSFFFRLRLILFVDQDNVQYRGCIDHLKATSSVRTPDSGDDHRKRKRNSSFGISSLYAAPYVVLPDKLRTNEPC